MALYYPSVTEDRRIVARGYPEKTDIQWQLSQDQIAPGSIQLEGILIKGPADPSPSSPRV